MGAMYIVCRTGLLCYSIPQCRSLVVNYSSGLFRRLPARSVMLYKDNEVDGGRGIMAHHGLTLQSP